MDTDRTAGNRKGRPNYPADFKRRLAIGACAPGISVSKLAQQNDINANMLFKWCRELRAGLFEPATLLTRKEMPATPPTLNEIIRLIAQVGGFLGRKSDDEPGVNDLARFKSSSRRTRNITRTARWAWPIYV